MSRGKTPDYVDDSEIAVINQACIYWDGIKFYKAKHQNPGKYNPRHALQNRDVLICSTGTGTLGRAAVYSSVTDKAIADSHVTVVRTNEKLLPEYLSYYLMFDATQKELYAKCVNGSTNQIELSKDKLLNFTIPDVSIVDQQEIVSQLCRVSSIIDLRNKELSLLDDLIKARFVELSSQWETQKEPEPLYAYLDDITYGFTNPMPDADEGPWKITAKDVVDRHINLKKKKKTTQEAYDSLTAKSKPEIGSVLLTKDGTLGRTATVEDNNICVNQSVAVLKTNNRVLPKFLEVLLRIPVYQRELLKDSGGGTIKHIYITKVDKMLIVVPDLEEQQKYINYVSHVDALKAAVQKALDEAQLLFDSLMQQYFG